MTFSIVYKLKRPEDVKTLVNLIELINYETILDNNKVECKFKTEKERRKFLEDLKSISEMIPHKYKGPRSIHYEPELVRQGEEKSVKEEKVPLLQF